MVSEVTELRAHNGERCALVERRVAVEEWMECVLLCGLCDTLFDGGGKYGCSR